jgi:type II secretory pathway pseudopilin PulG
MTRERFFAFTYMELLMVVTVIGILAAIGVPNFLEAQVRSKVAKAKTELLALSEALEAYYSDHLSYPPNYEPFPPHPGKKYAPTSRWTVPYSPHPLETPPKPGAPQVYPASADFNPFGPGPISPSQSPVTTYSSAGLSSPTIQGVGVPPGAPMDPFGGPGFTSPTMVGYPGPPGWANPFGDPEAAMLGMAYLPDNSLQQVFQNDRETSHLPRPYLPKESGYYRFGFGSATVPFGGVDYSMRIACNSFALQALTTPIAYWGSRLPSDPFANVRHWGYGYVSYDPYCREPGWNLMGSGLAPHYLLLSIGPNTSQNLADPYAGEFILYDPTNGTISTGDILLFNGEERMPDVKLPFQPTPTPIQPYLMDPGMPPPQGFL